MLNSVYLSYIKWQDWGIECFTANGLSPEELLLKYLLTCSLGHRREGGAPAREGLSNVCHQHLQSGSQVPVLSPPYNDFGSISQ